MTTPILTILKGEDGFVIYCDVSGQGLGAVLTQHGRVIAYASCKLKDYEKNYPTHNHTLPRIGCCGVCIEDVEALFVLCALLHIHRS